jgi:hypothetical protein
MGYAIGVFDTQPNTQTHSKITTLEIMGNDILKPILSLNPIAVAFLICFWGFGSLALIAIRTNTLESVLLRHPGFIVGDFFLLPMTGLLIAYFYQHTNATGILATSKLWTIGGVILATILTSVSAVRNDLMNIWFIPHGTFYWFMAYMCATFFPKGLLILVMIGAEKWLWYVWCTALLTLSSHLILPMIFGSKVLPKP